MRIVRIVPIIRSPPTFSFASRVVDADRQHLTPMPGRGVDLTLPAHGLLPLPLNDALCAGLLSERACAHRSTSSATFALSQEHRSSSFSGSRAVLVESCGSLYESAFASCVRCLSLALTSAGDGPSGSENRAAIQDGSCFYCTSFSSKRPRFILRSSRPVQRRI